MAKAIYVDLSKEQLAALKELFDDVEKNALSNNHGMLLGQIMHDGRMKVGFVKDETALLMQESHGSDVGKIVYAEENKVGE